MDSNNKAIKIMIRVKRGYKISMEAKKVFPAGEWG